MYYEEKIINGKLMYRTSPDDEWVEVDYESLLGKYRHKNEIIQNLYKAQDELRLKLEKLEQLAMDLKNDPLFT